MLPHPIHAHPIHAQMLYHCHQPHLILCGVANCSGAAPNPGPELRGRVAVPEEERRASDMLAMRHAPIAALAKLCVVDDEAVRMDAASMLQHCRALKEKQRREELPRTLIISTLDGKRVTVEVTAQMSVAALKTHAQQKLGAPCVVTR